MRNGQIEILEECIAEKEKVIKKMSDFNNEVCLQLMEKKHQATDVQWNKANTK